MQMQPAETGGFFAPGLFKGAAEMHILSSNVQYSQHEYPQIMKLALHNVNKLRKLFTYVENYA